MKQSPLTKLHKINIISGILGVLWLVGNALLVTSNLHFLPPALIWLGGFAIYKTVILPWLERKLGITQDDYKPKILNVDLSPQEYSVIRELRNKQYEEKQKDNDDTTTNNPDEKIVEFRGKTGS